ncbi:hypothetical protein A2Z33_04710 [Candidatus Gottesmanbacteria bacterium RBG_16_52_11]|uniref:Glycosyltransferase 2-like domain-containing protein n=1 Tax=Candidatus Gottesmanbacteria bacterium RBG_16_52_11 TaxID=1798374 RepID=A0A1F5YU63_9BACT|nr:MAG: hypothetical protein A2Z33_04710 [Candidatus Gottesmanbacteria bacterium RBG_16_52_11]
MHKINNLLIIVLITHNSKDTIVKSIRSTSQINNSNFKITCADNYSTDDTVKIIKNYGGKVYLTRETNFGKLKQFIVSKATGEWVLVLDSDEEVTPELGSQISKVINSPESKFDGYRIPYRNYCLGKPVTHGGEHYSKLILFRRGKGRVDPAWIHEEVTVNGRVGELSGYMNHYSYRSIPQIFAKFTDYSGRMARKAAENGEKATLRNLFLHAPHMFWSRFVTSRGYKDGWRGLLLAAAFAYMEQMAYINLAFRRY